MVFPSKYMIRIKTQKKEKIPSSNKDTETNKGGAIQTQVSYLCSDTYSFTTIIIS